MRKIIGDSIISSCLIVFKVNVVDIDVVCPLFLTYLLIKERVIDSIKYVINPNLMEKRCWFIPLRLKKDELESGDSYATSYNYALPWFTS